MPKINVQPVAINFSTVGIDSDTRVNLTITNNGNAILLANVQLPYFLNASLNASFVS